MRYHIIVFLLGFNHFHCENKIILDFLSNYLISAHITHWQFLKIKRKTVQTLFLKRGHRGWHCLFTVDFHWENVIKSDNTSNHQHNHAQCVEKWALECGFHYRGFLHFDTWTLHHFIFDQFTFHGKFGCLNNFNMDKFAH